MEVMSSQKLIIETINLPDDLLNYILLFLDTKKLEEIGFRFKPNEFYNNIQKEITWKPCYSEIEKKQSVIIPPKRFQQIYESYFFQNEQIKEHSFTKVLFSKFASHPYHREFNPVFSYDELFNAMDDIIIEGNFEKYVGTHLFKQVCGNSKDMNVGKRTVKAIENFIGP